jgi:hypothetical protein
MFGSRAIRVAGEEEALNSFIFSSTSTQLLRSKSIHEEEAAKSN